MICPAVCGPLLSFARQQGDFAPAKLWRLSSARFARLPCGARPRGPIASFAALSRCDESEVESRFARGPRVLRSSRLPAHANPSPPLQTPWLALLVGEALRFGESATRQARRRPATVTARTKLPGLGERVAPARSKGGDDPSRRLLRGPAEGATSSSQHSASNDLNGPAITPFDRSPGRQARQGQGQAVGIAVSTASASICRPARRWAWWAKRLRQEHHRALHPAPDRADVGRGRWFQGQERHEGHAAGPSCVRWRATCRSSSRIRMQSLNPRMTVGAIIGEALDHPQADLECAGEYDDRIVPAARTGGPERRPHAPLPA